MLSRTSFRHGQILRVSFIQGISSNRSHVLARNLKLGLRWTGQPKIQHFSTKEATKQAGGWQTWSTRMRRFATVAKYVRIPFLMVSVYALGRQQGIIECSRNPRLVEDELLQSILADVGRFGAFGEMDTADTSDPKGTTISHFLTINLLHQFRSKGSVAGQNFHLGGSSGCYSDGIRSTAIQDNPYWQRHHSSSKSLCKRRDPKSN